MRLSIFPKFNLLDFTVHRRNSTNKILIVACFTSQLFSCQTGASRENRLAEFDDLEAQQLEAVAQAEVERQLEIREAAKLRREAVKNLELKRKEQQRRQRRLEFELAANQSKEPQTATQLADSDLPDKTVVPINVESEQNAVNTQTGQTVHASQVTAPAASSWQLSRDQPSPVDGEPLCALVSQPKTVMHGDLTTTIALILTKDITFIRADASFNEAGIGTGVQIDSGLPIPFDRYLNEVTAVIDANHKRLASAFANGTFVTLNFAYLPSVTDNDILSTEISLNGFSDLFAELGSCG